MAAFNRFMSGIRCQAAADYALKLVLTANSKIKKLRSKNGWLLAGWRRWVPGWHIGPQRAWFLSVPG